ncbi:MAG: YqgE/AlgH family protein [Propionibacteriaceae bacterium]|nr:YqgE/AlgH family protein [Propionibacteriaceae bacterium]
MIPGEPRAGQLLIARDPGDGSYFDRSVVLLLDHDDEGSVGVCLHQPGTQPLPSPLMELHPLLTPPAVIFEGGPVNENAIVALAQLHHPREQPDCWQPLFGDVGSVALDVPIEELDGPFSHLRLFMGLAGWGPGQLIGELLRGSWYRTLPTAEEIFATPDHLWQRVLKRCGGEPGLWSTWTDTPAWN